MKTIKLTIPILLAFIGLGITIALLSFAISPAIAAPDAQQGAASPAELITSQQALSTAWQDLGGEINVSRRQNMALWVELVISDSTNARLRALGLHTSGGSEEYVFPIKTVGSSSVAVEDQFFELTDDVDQNVVISWEIDNVIPIVQFQVQAGVVGTTAGVISSAQVTLGY